jgi:SPP1 family predicted phage head-tail adaptor
MLNFKPAMMRHRITIKTKTRSQDANGIESVTWTNVATKVPAQFHFLSGRELIASKQQTAEFKARVTIYKRTDIDESMVIVFDGNDYDIVAIQPDPTNEVYQTIMVRKYG